MGTPEDAWAEVDMGAALRQTGQTMRVLAMIEEDPGLRELRDHVAAVLSGDTMLSDDPGHDLQHCLRVAEWALRIAAPGVNERDLIAAALMHDYVNYPKNSPERALASQHAADRAREILPAYGFEPESISIISDAVRDHSFSRGAIPESDLGKALQDADRLEALGALGLFRTISTGTRMGARYFHATDPWAKNRELDDLKYSVDHFFTKLLKLAHTMQTPAGRDEANRRVDFLRATLDQLASELAVGDAPSH